ncbi:4-carboxymuconolactone decarboxylase [Novosphingobium sp. SG751A]|uniref:carboxymuconolactone decarboxylase family protein n=1 Tax=Novosphingobium sp. SG751A TaxID=2587000 RepID=UPI001C12C892|nr:carboxymuconolactone decarboxylase family protein [Novosphingobium sp. SG751A]NOW45023.1 4-carboxymuconolactone decarboxylase [Novosphingobium sp. SG751A]
MTEVHAQTPLDAARPVTREQVRSVAPALDHYAQERLEGTVWKRPGLSTRDRCLVTIAALVARGQSFALGYYTEKALDNGVKPAEISETITHLAYYVGWPNAMAAIAPVGDVFARHHIGADQLPAIAPSLLPIDEKAEAARAKLAGDSFAATAPGLVDYTTDYLFKDLWLRPDLAPSDRSLITMAALIAAGQTAQIPYHLNRAMDNGLTETQAAEVITHLAFYAGWPNAMSALPVAKDVFAKRHGQ